MQTNLCLTCILLSCIDQVLSFQLPDGLSLLQVASARSGHAFGHVEGSMLQPLALSNASWLQQERASVARAEEKSSEPADQLLIPSYKSMRRSDGPLIELPANKNFEMLQIGEAPRTEWLPFSALQALRAKVSGAEESAVDAISHRLEAGIARLGGFAQSFTWRFKAIVLVLAMFSMAMGGVLIGYRLAKKEEHQALRDGSAGNEWWA